MNKKNIMTPVNKGNVSVLLKRLDDTGLIWIGCVSRPSERIFRSYHNVKTLHIDSGYLLWGDVVGAYTEEVEDGKCKLVTWNEFVRIARERCGNQNEL